MKKSIKVLICVSLILALSLVSLIACTKKTGDEGGSIKNTTPAEMETKWATTFTKNASNFEAKIEAASISNPTTTQEATIKRTSTTASVFVKEGNDMWEQLVILKEENGESVVHIFARAYKKGEAVPKYIHQTSTKDDTSFPEIYQFFTNVEFNDTNVKKQDNRYIATDAALAEATEFKKKNRDDNPQYKEIYFETDAVGQTIEQALNADDYFMADLTERAPFKYRVYNFGKVADMAFPAADQYEDAV